MNKQEIHEIAKKAFAENNYQPLTLEELTKNQGIDRKKFKKWREETGADIGFPDVTKTIVRVVDVFEEPLSLEAAYWLGYIAADGCIAKGQTNTSLRLMLECKIDDKEILEKFCNFIGIRKDRISLGHNGKSCCLSIYNKNFTTFVTEYNIQFNKSYIENTIDDRILENDDLFFQFLKGYIDGDGCITTSCNSKGILLVGDKTFLSQIKSKLQQILPYDYLNLRDITKSAKAKRSLYELKIGLGYKRKNIELLYNKMYENSFIVLTRKYNKIRCLRPL